jgi:hypothetical protein
MEMLDLIGGAPSVAVGVICLVLAGVLITVGRMQWPLVAVALVLTGTAGVVNGTIGVTVHQAATQVDRWAGQAIGTLTGVAVTGVVALALVAALGFWIYQRRIGTGALLATAAVPVASTLIPGTAGVVIMTIVGIVPAVLGGVVSWLFFGAW